MKPLARVTPATVDVLAVLLDAAGGRGAAADADGGAVWGLRIIKESGRPPGSVYPILERLEGLGWLEGEWEDDPARSGPRRRYYRLTGEGRALAAATVSEFEAKKVAAQRASAAIVIPIVVTPTVGLA